MKPIAIASWSLAAIMILLAGSLMSQTNFFTVTIDRPVNGSLGLDPQLPADGRYPGGTVVTVTAVPDSGYALDSVYYAVPGRFGQMYHEGIARDFKVVIDQNKRIGASFIEEAAVNHL